MPIAPISNPFIRNFGGVNQCAVQLPPVTEAATQNWLKGSFVQTTGTGASVVLQVCPTAATAVYGVSPDGAKGTTSPSIALQPPNALFGLRHYPFDISEALIEVNAVSGTAGDAVIGTANGVTWNGGGTNGVALAPGLQRGLWRAATGIGALMHFFDVNNSTAGQEFFEIVSIAPGMALTDNNPRILVKIVAARIQGGVA